jgi:IstB-like ATP binding protein
MLTHPTCNRLVALGLTGMAKAFDEQQQQPDIAALGFDERFALLVDREATERENKRLVNRLRFAALRQNAVVEDISAETGRVRSRRRACNRAAGGRAAPGRQPNKWRWDPRPYAAAAGATCAASANSLQRPSDRPAAGSCMFTSVTDRYDITAPSYVNYVCFVFLLETFSI